MAAAADPVLLGAHDAGVLFQQGSAQQSPVDLEQLPLVQLVNRTGALHHEPHRVDVGEHLRGGEVFDVPSQLARCLGAQQPARADFQALDARGRDGLGPQQDARQRLGFDQRGRLDVQARDRHLRVHDVGGHVAVERDARPASGSGTYAS